MHATTNWIYFANAVDSNELPGGDGLLDSLTHLKPWLEGTGNSFMALNILLADGLLLWRTWIVWGRQWWIILFPMLGTLSGLGLGIVAIYSAVLSDVAREPLDQVKQTRNFVVFSIAYFSTSIATSITATFLITLRIIIVQKSTAETSLSKNKLSQRYKGVIEIIVESAVLYSITLLIMVVFIATKNTNVYYPQNIHAQMAGIAPLLIILRVASGHSRPDSEWSNSGILSEIRFWRTERIVTTDYTATLELEETPRDQDGIHTYDRDGSTSGSTLVTSYFGVSNTGNEAR
ncbi:hypothetical protein VKT23_016583 [Stygiomarasmius scandens]|uniref:Uncharacterized protein n=1 Tax=Marasmiellus scandens TaxID=2682957 RepID=A0ABR1IUV8_9AGAR